MRIKLLLMDLLDTEEVKPVFTVNNPCVPLSELCSSSIFLHFNLKPEATNWRLF